MVRSLSSNFDLYSIICAMGTVGLMACSSPPWAGDNSVGGQSSVQGSSGGFQTTGGSGTAGGSANGGAVAVGGATKGGTTAAVAPTWSQLFSNYFGPNTAGDCVASGCHGSDASPTFTNAASMCSAMKNNNVIGNGTASFDVVLKWFNKGGIMPRNNNATPPNAVADITAWEKAGAVCP